MLLKHYFEMSTLVHTLKTEVTVVQCFVLPLDVVIKTIQPAIRLLPLDLAVYLKGLITHLKRCTYRAEAVVLQLD